MPFEHLEEKEAVKKAALIVTNGYRFYTLLANRVEKREVREVLKKLAKDELRHLKLIETNFFPEAGFGEQITDEELSIEYSLEETGEADIFTRRINVEGLIGSMDSTKNALILALDTERYSVKFFEDLAEKSKSSGGRRIYKGLADEERSHVSQIEGLLAAASGD